MLQRIQTIWLLLAGIAALLTLKFPSYVGIQNTAVTYHELNGVTAGILIMLVTITVSVIAFVTIGLYKARPMQLKLCIAGIILEALLMFLYYRQATVFAEGRYTLTSILHIAVLLFFGLALKGVNSDEKLIKESDRLR